MNLELHLTMVTLHFGFEMVDLNVQHCYMSDLKIA